MKALCSFTLWAAAQESWKLSGNITGRGRILITISVRLQKDMNIIVT